MLMFYLALYVNFLIKHVSVFRYYEVYFNIFDFEFNIKYILTTLIYLIVDNNFKMYFNIGLFLNYCQLTTKR